MIQALHEQIETLPIPAEIICIDDHSEEAFHHLNSEVNSLIDKYIRLDKNVGRAKIRNLFLNHAQHDYLLFLDCDGVIAKSDFLMTYAHSIATAPSVICGGRIYAPNSDRTHRLRYIYGVRCEAQDAATRKQNPSKSFMTNNFVIRRELLSQIRFDETLAGYGHEDTLFGFALKEAGIAVQHIDNQVIVADLDDNALFLQKTEEAIRNLVLIYQKLPDKAAFSEEVTILKAYCKLKKWHLIGFVRFLFTISGAMCRRFFLSGNASMLLFKFYKLGLLVRGISE